MGWCQEFGTEVSPGCDHSMRAGSSSCSCDGCGTECGGKFSGCADVWSASHVEPPKLVESTAGLEVVPAPANDVGDQADRDQPEGSQGVVAVDESLSASLREALATLRSEVRNLNQVVETPGAKAVVSPIKAESEPRPQSGGTGQVDASAPAPERQAASGAAFAKTRNQGDEIRGGSLELTDGRVERADPATVLRPWFAPAPGLRDLATRMSSIETGIQHLVAPVGPVWRVAALRVRGNDRPR